MAPRLVGLVLEVQDLERSIAFYRDAVALALSARQEWEGHRLAFLEGEEVELTLVQQPPGEGAGAPLLGAGVVVHFAVPDAAGQLRRLEEAGARLVRPLEDAPWGGRTFVVADPDGYNLMFTGP